MTSLVSGIHPDDLRKHTNKELADMYFVSMRTVKRARRQTGIKREVNMPVFTEQEFREMSRERLAKKLGTTEHYVRRYAKEQGWRK